MRLSFNMLFSLCSTIFFFDIFFFSSDCSDDYWGNTSDEDQNCDNLSDTDTDDEQIDIVRRQAITNHVFDRFARAFGDSQTRVKPVPNAKKEEGIVTYFAATYDIIVG